jgi:ELWxxDGT repeat protein
MSCRRGSSSRFEIEQLEERRLLAAHLLTTLRGYPKHLQAAGDYLYYSLYPDSAATESTALQRTDGTAAGTRTIARPGYSTTGYYLRADPFLARDLGDRTLVTTDSNNNAFWLDNITGARRAGLTRDVLGNVNGNVISRSFYSSDEIDIWSSTAGGEASARIAVVRGTKITSLLSSASHLYFLAESPLTQQLWHTDGTAPGTRLLQEFRGTKVDVRLQPCATNRAFFVVSTRGQYSGQLWITDGTAAGTHAVSGAPKIETWMIAAGSRAFFGLGAQHGFAIWVSDGSAAGTRRVAVMAAPSVPGTDIYGVTAYTQRALGSNLILETAAYGLRSTMHQVWRVSPSGRLSLIRNGAGYALTTFRDKLYFIDDRRGLFESDGTAAGTRFTGAGANELVANENGVFFSNGKQLYTATPARGAARGVVWNDQNSDGVRDKDEDGVENQSVYLDLNRNGALDQNEPSTRTDPSGWWRIAGLPAGNYLARLRTDADWAPTMGNVKPITVRALGGAVWNSAVRGAPGSISGTVHNDLNGDGQIDPGEGGIEGMRVFLDRDRDGVFDANEISTRTGANGTYRFDGLPSGRYRIEVDHDELWVPQGGAGQSVLLRPRGIHDDDFFLTPMIRIRGSVFFDANSSGGFDSGETGEIAILYLDVNQNGHEDDGEPYALSDLDGTFSFVLVPLGTYQVRALFSVFRPNSALTSPAAGYYTVSASSPRIFSDLRFGFGP